MKNSDLWQGALWGKLQLFKQGYLKGILSVFYPKPIPCVSLAKSQERKSGLRVAQEWLKYAATLLLIFTLGVSNAWGTYTITFNGSNSESTNITTSTTAASITGSSTYVTGNVATATRVYGATSDGIKLGASSNAGTIRINLSTSGQVTPTSIVVNCKLYNSGKSATLKVNGSATQSVPASSGDLTFNITSAITYIQLESSKYIWVKSVTVNTPAATNVTLHWATNGSGGTSTSTQAQTASLPTKSDLDCGWEFIGWMPNEYTGKSSSGMINAGQTAGSNTNLYALYSHPTYGSTNSLSTSPRIYTVTQSNSNATESTYNYDCVSNVETDIVNYYGAASGYALSATTPTVTVGGVTVDPSNIMWDITGTYGDGPSYPGYLWISLGEYFGGNVVINVATELVCSSSVTVNTGSPTNCTISVSSASVSTCSSTESDRYVTVSVQPNTCYAAPVKASVTSTGTTATWVSGPTWNSGTSKYDYVYKFAQNATGSTTFNASLSTKTTYTVSYDKGTYGTGDNSSGTKTCGVDLTLPSSAMFTREGYTQTGWSTATAGNTKTYNLGASYTTDAATTLYPYWQVNTYTVTWKVNNTNYSAGGSTSVNHGSHISTLPTAPDPDDYCGDRFVGWTDAKDGAYVHGTSNLYKTASEFPNATEDQVFYAVFADYVTP